MSVRDFDDLRLSPHQYRVVLQGLRNALTVGVLIGTFLTAVVFFAAVAG